VLLQCAGSNATLRFDEVHAPDIIEELPKEKFMGFLEQPSADVPVAATAGAASSSPAAAIEATAAAAAAQVAPSSSSPTTPLSTVVESVAALPPIEAILSAPDLAAAAEHALTPKAWAFYSSAATDLVTHTKNKELVRRIMFRPRVLRNVKSVNFETSILGYKSKAPFFISPAAMARLAHPDGELALSRGAANEGIIQTVRCSVARAG
jgi:L-lactate dehydrogenase (cytochrome)